MTPPGNVAVRPLGGEPATAAERLDLAAFRLVDPTTSWSVTKWARPCRGGWPAALSPVETGEQHEAPTRAEVAYALAVRLAAWGAEAELREPVQLPRLDHDVSLPDQLAVLVDDLLRTAPSDQLLDEAADLVRTTGRCVLE